MNPFRRLRLIQATRYFSQEEGCEYGQGLKKISRQISAHRLLPSLRRPHGSGVGARTRLLRLALRELRRTDRSGDSRPSPTSCRACRSREAVCRPQRVSKKLTPLSPGLTPLARRRPTGSPLDDQIGAHLARQMMFSHLSGSLRGRTRPLDAGELSATGCCAPAVDGR